jgi:elongation factor P
MATTTDFKNGLILRMKNNLWKIIDFQHVKPGKGPAFVRTKLKNIKTGQVVDNTFRAGEKVESVRLESHSYNYSYSDGEDYFFMDNATYEQISLPKDTLSDIIDFLIENTSVDILFDGDIALEVRIPQHMNFIVSSTEQGEKGNTATGATKPAELETGLIIQVPLFIKEGEKIRVDTKEKKYIERTK